MSIQQSYFGILQLSPPSCSFEEKQNAWNQATRPQLWRYEQAQNQNIQQFPMNGSTKLSHPPLHSTTSPKEYPITSQPYRYNEVHVLMFVWEDDDLDCLQEVQQLEGVFSKLYNFNTYISIIPSRRPYRHVKNEISRFIDILNKPDCLVIVYYSGHGHLFQYGNLAWSAYE